MFPHEVTTINTYHTLYPSACEAKERNLEEFRKRGRILGAVSLIYYPRTSSQQPTVEVEIEGSCYTLGLGRGMAAPKSLHLRIYRMQRTNDHGVHPAYTFIRFGITVTPEKLNHILKNIDHIRMIFGLNCSHGANTMLRQYVGFGLPAPLSMLPTTTAMVLKATKTMGSRRISHISTYTIRTKLRELIQDFRIAIAPEQLIGLILTFSLIYFESKANLITGVVLTIVVLNFTDRLFF